MNKRFFKTLLRPAVACAMAVALTQMATAQTPVAYFNFNEPAGSTILFDGDLDGGTAYNATYEGMGTPSFGAGILRGAWQGNGGANERFKLPAMTDLSGLQDLSLTFWMNPDGFAANRGIITQRDDAFFGVANSGAPDSNGLQFRTAAGADGSVLQSTPNIIPVDQWTHVAAVYDGLSATRSIYINGALSDTDAAAADYSFAGTAEWIIGDDDCCGGREFQGLLDDLAIYNTRLQLSDVQSIYNNGINGIALDGTPNLVDGDVDGDGSVTGLLAGPDDLDPILANFLDTVGGGGVDTRPLGDLTNDGFVGLADFRQWKDNFPSSTVAAAGVPEPTSIVLLTLASLFGLTMLRRRPSQAIAAGLVVMAVSITSSSADAQVVVTIDQDTGTVTAADTGAGPIAFDGYEVSSTNGLLNPANWNSFNSQSVAGWEILGGTANPPSINRVAEALTSEGATVNFNAPINFGNFYDKSGVIAAQTAAGLGVDVRDVAFGFLEPGNAALTNATIEYTGETITNNLVVKIDATGNATLENESPFTLVVDAFGIQSAAGSLNDAWTGSPDLTSPDWLLGSNSVNGIGQVSPQNSVTLGAAVNGVVQSSGSIDLGNIFTVGGEGDVEFRFLRVGEDDGDGFLAAVEYDPGLFGLEGDYNGNGTVDAADYTVWRDGLDSGDFVQADYDVWKSNFGNTSATASGVVASQAVPEPSTLGLVLVGLVGFFRRRR